MKEATGDLNMTVVIVLMVAGLVAFFSMVIKPIVIDGIRGETNCSDAVCKCSSIDPINGKCNGEYSCTYKGKTVNCPYKG